MVGQRTSHYRPHPGLPDGDQPDRVRREAAGSRSAFVSLVGVQGTGKTTWARALAAQSRRTVWVAADSFESDLPFAFADKVIRACGGRLASGAVAPELDVRSVADAVLAALLGTGGLRNSVLVVLDNVQWIDRQSVAVLRYALGRLGYQRFHVVLAGWPPAQDVIETLRGADDGIWAFQRNITLLPLATGQVRRYVAAVHGREVSLLLSDRIRDRTGGLLPLIDAMMPALPKSGPDVPIGDDVLLPPRGVNPFHGLLVLASTSARTAVDISCVLVDPLSRSELELIASALGEPADIEAALACGLLVARDDETIMPFHDLLAVAVAAEVSDVRLAMIREAGARAIDNEHRAFALRLAAASRLGATLRRDLEQQVSRLATGGRVDRALRYLHDAARLCSGADRDWLLVEAGVLAAAHNATRSVLRFLPELERMPPSPVGEFARLHALYAGGRGDLVRAETHRFLNAATRAPDDALLQAELSVLIAAAHMTSEDYDDVLAILDRGKEHAAAISQGPPVDPRLRYLLRTGDLALRLNALAMVAAGRQGDAQRFRREMAELTARIAAAPASPGLADALTCLAGVLLRHGDVFTATGHLERAIAVADDQGPGWAIGQARCLLTVCYWMLGRHAEARVVLDSAALRMLDELDLSVRPLTYALLALLAATGHEGDAVDKYLAAAAEVRLTGYRSGGLVYELLARAEIARARASHRDVLSILTPEVLSCGGLAMHPIVAYRIEALADAGEVAQAQRELDAFTTGLSTGAPLPFGDLDWLQGRIYEAHGRLEAARVRYARVVARDQLPLPAARAQLSLGRILLTLGRTQAGQRHLRAARTSLLRIGCELYVGEIDRLLGHAGTSSDPQLMRLSAREREIHALAATGLTNAEIAQRLYISVPTVAFHIRNVLAKIGVTSRRDLRPDALRASGE